MVGAMARSFVAPATVDTVKLEFPAGAKGTDTITMAIGATQSPKSLGLANDPRPLGLVLVGIEIRPSMPVAQP